LFWCRAQAWVVGPASASVIDSGRDKPGFAHRLGGWRMLRGELDDRIQWSEAFVTEE